MSQRDPLQGHEYKTEILDLPEGKRLRMICKCGWTKNLKLNTGTGTGLRVTWHVHCQEILANHN